MKKKLGLMTHIIIYGVFGVGLVSLVSLASSAPAFATCTTDSTTGVVTCSESASATVHVAEACTMTATNNTPHTAEIANGLYSGGISEYSNGIGKTTLKVVCNDASGFSIYAVGYTNNEFGNTKLMTDASDTSAPIINTGTADSGDTSAWAMKVSPVTGTFAPTSDNSFNSFHNIPNVYTRVAYRTSGTDMNSDPTLATGSSVEATYAAYVSPNQPAGTYVGKVKYTLVHPNTETPKDAPITCAANKICYGPNANDVEGTMGVQSAGSNIEYTLLASNFSRKGYGFAGWSESQNAASDPTAKIYGPQETITTGDLTSKGMSLYAVWVKSEGSIQDSSKVTAVCNRLTQAPTDGTANISSVSALTDQRDNETYAIAKLADGKCWMIENLRLDNTAEHNSDGTLAQGYGGQFAGLADSEPAWANYINTANSLYYSGTQDGTASIDIGTSGNPPYRFPRYNYDNTNTRAANPAPTSNSSAMYSYGNYYSWPAAIADTDAYNTSNNTSVTNTSICPSGWHLPKGGSSANATNSDFWQLGLGIMGAAPSNNKLYTSSETNSAGKTATEAFKSYPNNFVYSGNVYSGSVNDRGSKGSFWASTAYSSNNAYYLSLLSSFVSPGSNDYYKYYGCTVRCVASGV